MTLNRYARSLKAQEKLFATLRARAAIERNQVEYCPHNATAGVCLSVKNCKCNCDNCTLKLIKTIVKRVNQNISWAQQRADKEIKETKKRNK
jgi:hypothetical protein